MYVLESNYVIYLSSLLWVTSKSSYPLSL